MLNKYIFGLLFGGDGNMLFPDYSAPYKTTLLTNKRSMTINKDCFIRVSSNSAGSSVAAEITIDDYPFAIFSAAHLFVKAGTKVGVKSSDVSVTIKEFSLVKSVGGGG